MNMITPTIAAAKIHAQVPAAIAEHRPLTTLTGLVLRETIKMEREQPPFDRVMMDGIALQSAAVQDGREFEVVDVQMVGTAAKTLPHSRACIEVMTGAVLPHGCDCVIPIEQITVQQRRAYVQAETVRAGMYVHARGSDCAAGQVILQPGVILGAVEVAAIATAGYSGASVSAQPSIIVISTGNELVEPGVAISPWQIRRSNVYGLQAALLRRGFKRVSEDHLIDDEGVLQARLQAHLDMHDVVVLSGGVSMGQFDHVPHVLQALGVRCIFHTVAQRPGKPMWFGVRDDGKVVYALPGNPVSSLVCLARYVIPGLYAAMDATPPTVKLPLAAAVAAPHALLTSFLPARVGFGSAQQPVLELQHSKNSGDFVSLLGADGFVELAPGQDLALGVSVPFYAW